MRIDILPTTLRGIAALSLAMDTPAAAAPVAEQPVTLVQLMQRSGATANWHDFPAPKEIRVDPATLRMIAALRTRLTAPGEVATIGYLTADRAPAFTGLAGGNVNNVSTAQLHQQVKAAGHLPALDLHTHPQSGLLHSFFDLMQTRNGGWPSIVVNDAGTFLALPPSRPVKTNVEAVANLASLEDALDLPCLMYRQPAALRDEAGRIGQIRRFAPLGYSFYQLDTARGVFTRIEPMDPFNLVDYATRYKADLIAAMRIQPSRRSITDIRDALRDKTLAAVIRQDLGSGIDTYLPLLYAGWDKFVLMDMYSDNRRDPASPVMAIVKPREADGRCIGSRAMVYFLPGGDPYAVPDSGFRIDYDGAAVTIEELPKPTRSPFR
ncbi:hypothetical protein [Sphingomonas sp. VNH70]|uniref:hypothetical protein n=1 Tax=Sphingomonas silueang TaxID=3156617 RepID=UPI0032B4B4F8